MNKHKIRLYHKPKLHRVNDNPNHLIGGVTEEINLVLVLSQVEYEKLNECLVSRRNVVNALYDFTHSNVCSKHHKYKVWNTFKEIGDISYNYMGNC